MKNEFINNSLIKSLLEEVKKLNETLSMNNMSSEFSTQDCIFLYGFNTRKKAEPELYKKYVAFSNHISSVLAEFGISAKNNGYSYIVDAVSLIIDQNRLDLKLRNDVYPHIKNKYRLDRDSSVEHSIRNAIKAAWLKCTLSTVVSRMNSYSKKPTNREFLYMVTQDVCLRMNKDLML